MKLSDYIEQVRGVSYGKSDVISEPFENYIPVLRSNNIKKSKIDLSDLVYVNPSKVKEKQLLRKGDILITASTGSIKVIGKNAYCKNDYEAAFGAFCKVIRPKNINHHYLKHMFQSPHYFEYIQNIVNGANINNIKNEHLDNFKIPLPPIKTQQRIAKILDNAAALRDKTAQLLTEYDLLAQSIFLDMFGDTYSNPKNFPMMLIEELAANRKHSIKAGPFGSSLKKEFYVESGYKIYGQEQVIKDDLNFGDYYIDEERYQKLKSCKIDSGDILISLVGTYGKISVVPEKFKKGIINPRLMKISPNQNIIRSDYLKTVLKSNGVAFQLKNKSRGGTMDIINVGIIRKVRTAVPPIELQNQFAEKIALIEQQKALAKQELQEAKDLFNCLLQKAFKGELV